MPAVGVVFPARAPAGALPGFARSIEALGYTDLWVIEDCFYSGGLTLAATALGATERLRVGVGLLPAAVRNAAIVSMELATLATIHPGRLTVAFGHGVDSWMRQIGARPRNRVAALEEIVTTVRMLLAGETVNGSGELVALEAVKLDNPPQVPPSILVGTTGPRGLRIAGNRADGVLLPEGCGAPFIEYASSKVRGAAPGDGTSTEVIAYAWLSLGDDGPGREALAAAVAGWLEMGLFPGPMRKVGISPSADAGALAPATIDELAITGTPAQCACNAQRMLDAGLSRLIVAAVGDDYVEQYERFAQAVVPELELGVVTA
jgi:alkanesulfonate monooxygenase SsuD/methylene tetrahydromethanopterin reductase-like flavin-dependent oxidoreductase (luciferase family)